MQNKQYTVTLTNTFGASSMEDALAQMIVWCLENAPHAGYRIDVEGLSLLVDADSVDMSNILYDV